jgi:hypothetical protein
MEYKVLNEKICLQHGLTLKEAMLLYILKEDHLIGPTLAGLRTKGAIMKSVGVYHEIDPTWGNIISNTMNMKDKKDITEKDIDSLITKLQELFPKERKTDEKGIPKYSFRGNKIDVKNKLIKFLKIYKKVEDNGNVRDYTLDEIYEATQRYVNKYSNDKTYLKLLPYFIIKDSESTLANELENSCDDSVDNLNYVSNVELL